MFALPGNGHNLDAFSFTERVVGYQREECLLDYRHKKVNDKLCTNMGGLHVTACRHRKGLIQEAKLLVVAPSKEVGSVSLQEDIHRSGEKNNELLH